MRAGHFTALLHWRPDDREKRLLQLLLGIAIVGWLYTAFEARQNAAADNAAAQQRLATTRTRFDLLSSNQLRGEIAMQKKLLARLVIAEATPAISEIRLRGEILALSSRAGLPAPIILDNSPTDTAATDKSVKQRFSVLTSTVEFDFEWAGLLRLLEEVEYHDRGYFLDGFEVRQEGDKRRMRVTIRALHQYQGAGV
jgi:hypothetical protein